VADRRLAAARPGRGRKRSENERESGGRSFERTHAAVSSQHVCRLGGSGSDDDAVSGMPY
jgi:hypothetical protein